MFNQLGQIFIYLGRCCLATLCRLRHCVGAFPNECRNQRVKELKFSKPTNPAISDKGLSVPLKYWLVRFLRTRSMTAD
jgi:hypothetical protein